MAAGTLDLPSLEGRERSKDYLRSDKMIGRAWTYQLRRLARRVAEIRSARARRQPPVAVPCVARRVYLVHPVPYRRDGSAGERIHVTRSLARSTLPAAGSATTVA